MNAKTISLGIAGFGAVLFLLAVIIWGNNKPDFHARAASVCRSVNNPGTTRYQECYAHASGQADRASSAYNSCLFNGSNGLCQEIGAVPYLSIAGVMILLIGGGLFAFNAKRRTSAPPVS